MSTSKRWFSFTTGAVAIPASGATGNPVISTIRIQGNDFEVLKFTGSALLSSGAAGGAYVLVKITLTNRNEDLVSVAVPFNDIIGTAQLPSIVSNLQFEANTNIDITLSNSNALVNTVSVTFIGHKIFTVARS